MCGLNVFALALEMICNGAHCLLQCYCFIGGVVDINLVLSLFFVVSLPGHFDCVMKIVLLMVCTLRVDFRWPFSFVLYITIQRSTLTQRASFQTGVVDICTFIGSFTY